MVLSVRDVAQRRLGLNGAFSVTDDLYGYPFRAADGTVFGTLAVNDTFPRSGQPLTRSLTEHLRTIDGPATNLCVILVGHEDDFSGVVSRLQVATVQYGLQVMRDLYAQQGFGVRRILWQRIPKADAGSAWNLANRAEVKTLTSDWTCYQDGIDVFVVQSIVGAWGYSHSPGAGPCDKNDAEDLSGVVGICTLTRHLTGIMLAHEVGHYLGLDHTTSMANVMGDDPDGDGIGAIDDGSLALSATEGATMKTHCSVS